MFSSAIIPWYYRKRERSKTITCGYVDNYVNNYKGATMEITIISVGKLTEKYLKAGISEYVKRMKSYASVNLIEVNDEPAPNAVSDKDIEQIKNKEGKRIIEKIPDRARVVALDLRGKQMTSTQFAKKVNETMTYGTSHIVFIIGGSYGLSDEVLKKRQASISFGKMTYPHQLMRLILMEQIYRAFKIIRNEPYHK